MDYLDVLVQAGFKVTIQYFYKTDMYGVHIFPLHPRADTQDKESYDICGGDLADILKTSVTAILGTQVKSEEGE